MFAMKIMKKAHILQQPDVRVVMRVVVEVYSAGLWLVEQ